MKAEQLKGFLNTMVDSIEKDNIELFKKIIDTSKIKDYNNPEEFFYGVLYTWDNFISAFLKFKLNANSDVEFIFKNSQYINMHFKNLFVKYEGNTCSTDKSRNIINKLFNYYMTGEEIEFDYDNKYTFHLPKKIFRTHKDIIDFYEGLKYLLYGKPEKYLEALKSITEKV